MQQFNQRLRVRLRTWIHRQGLRHQHQRMRVEPLPEQRHLHRRHCRLFLHLFGRFYWSALRSQHRWMRIVTLPERRAVPGRHQFVPMRLQRHGVPRRSLPDQRRRLHERPLCSRLWMRRSSQRLSMPMSPGIRGQELRTGRQRMRTDFSAVP